MNKAQAHLESYQLITKSKAWHTDWGSSHIDLKKLENLALYLALLLLLLTDP